MAVIYRRDIWRCFACSWCQEVACKGAFLPCTTGFPAAGTGEEAGPSHYTAGWDPVHTIQRAGCHEPWARWVPSAIRCQVRWGGCALNAPAWLSSYVIILHSKALFLSPACSAHRVQLEHVVVRGQSCCSSVTACAPSCVLAGSMDLILRFYCTVRLMRSIASPVIHWYPPLPIMCLPSPLYAHLLYVVLLLHYLCNYSCTDLSQLIHLFWLCCAQGSSWQACTVKLEGRRRLSLRYGRQWHSGLSTRKTVMKRRKGEGGRQEDPAQWRRMRRKRSYLRRSSGSNLWSFCLS